MCVYIYVYIGLTQGLRLGAVPLGSSFKYVTTRYMYIYVYKLRQHHARVTPPIYEYAFTYATNKKHTAA